MDAIKVTHEDAVKVSGFALSGLAVLLALAYHTGFWMDLGINILQFMSLVDMVKSSAWGLVFSLLGVVIGTAIGHAAAMAEIRRHEREGKVKYGKIKTVVMALGMTALLVTAFVLKVDGRWLFGSALVGSTLAAIARGTSLMLELVPSTRLRTAVSVAFITMPLVAWGYGREQVQRIVEGKNYLRANLSAVAENGSEIRAGFELRYLMNTGSYTLLLVENGSVLVLRNEEVGAIELVKVDRQRGL
jgi:hypothetical protein